MQTCKVEPKKVVLDKKFDHAAAIKRQFEEYDPYSRNLHHPLLTILEATGALIVKGKLKGISENK